MAQNLSIGQFRFMRRTHNSLMHDACKLVTRTAGAIVHNVPSNVYTVAPLETICGFDPTPGRIELGGTRVIEYGGTFRIPHGTPIDNLGGFRLTRQANEPIIPRSYMLAAPPEFGHTAITCRVNAVTDSAF